MRRGPRPHLRYAALVRDRWRCRYCGDTHPQMEADHVHPVVDGGQETLDNLVAACRTCNRSKGSRRKDPLPPDTSPLTEEDVLRMFSAWRAQEGSQGAARVADVSKAVQAVVRFSTAPLWRVYATMVELLDPVALLASCAAAQPEDGVRWATDGRAAWRVDRVLIDTGEQEPDEAFLARVDAVITGVVSGPVVVGDVWSIAEHLVASIHRPALAGRTCTVHGADVLVWDGADLVAVVSRVRRRVRYVWRTRL